MGQKVNPFGFRLGNLYSWRSRWYSDKIHYPKLVLEDTKLRRFLTEKLRMAGLTKVEIERSINNVRIILPVSRPGVVIGKGGTALEQLPGGVRHGPAIHPTA